MWCLLLGSLESERERERERERVKIEERDRRGERNEFFIINLLCSLYYFIGLYVQIRIKIFGVLLNKLVK